jgi:CRP/FNR family transcriptional regulator, cyclic AMP receptor protein
MATPDGVNRNLFSALPAELAGRLFAKARPVRLSAGQSLFIATEVGEGCYRIGEGLLKVSMLSASGRERILAILGPGSVVGELSILAGTPRSTTVAAVKDSELSFVGRADFQSVLDEHPLIYKHLVILLAQRLLSANSLVAAASFLSLKGQVARALLDLAAAFGHDAGNGRILIRTKVTQSDLAAMAGIGRENVSRILSDWMRTNVVSRLAGYYCLENRKALQREAEM